jgi:hypothetical protein
MIPDFDEQGYLPPGVHLATMDEVALRFGTQSELRRVQTESLRWLVELASASGVLRLIINGSYTTDIAEPNDVDCALLIAPDFSPNSDAEAEIRQGIPFLDIHLVEMPDFKFYVETFYVTDRFFTPKGMVEVVLCT